MALTYPTDTGTIPVIDIGPLRDGSGTRKVGKALHQASQTVGFIYVTNHGIPDDLIKRAHETALAFFRQPEEVKERVAISQSHRGWLQMGGAVMGDDMPYDLKESFLWGTEDSAGNTPTDHPLRGANIWPDGVADFRDISNTYFDQAHIVAYALMRGFALGLGLDENFFLSSPAQPLSRASYVYYPSQPTPSRNDQFGAGPHTDFGVLTVLYQDAIGGLQIQDMAGSWIDAPPVDGTLVINVGDLLERWTGGAYRSTPHRVINESGQERLSLVLAYDPGPDTIIDAHQVLGTTAAAVEEPISCGDYLVRRFERAFAYRRTQQ